MAQDQALRLLLVGKTGSGKSSTGNTIFGEDLFDSDMDMSSVTSTCTLRRKEYNGTLVEVVDSPGLFDTKKKHEEVAADVVQAIACLHPGITAVLYVIMLGTRYTEEDTKVYERLKALLDPRVTQYMIIIFTRGDDLTKQKKTIESILLKSPDSFHTILRECNNRYVVFDNYADNKQPQVEQLLEVVHKLSQAHGGKPYTCPKYSEIGDKVEEEVVRRMQAVEEKEVKATTYGSKLVTETKEVQEKAEREKKEIEEREKKMQAQIKQTQVDLQKQREEFERKEKEKEELTKKKDKEMQEKMKKIIEEAEKQKTEFETKEEKRNEQMRKNDLEREKRLKSLQESLDKQTLSADRVQEEMKKFRQEAEAARKKERTEMDQQKEKDRQALANLQQQMMNVEKEKAASEGTYNTEKQRMKNEMKMLKDQIANMNSSRCVVQ